MKIRIIWIGKTKEAAIQSLSQEYLKRLARYVTAEALELPTQAAVEHFLKKEKVQPALVLLDSRGRQLSSEDFAAFFEDHQGRGTKSLAFVVGDADGLTPEFLARATFRLSLGKMTLPHELARVVLLEQVYRAFTILRGHPYHSGH